MSEKQDYNIYRGLLDSLSSSRGNIPGDVDDMISKIKSLSENDLLDLTYQDLTGRNYGKKASDVRRRDYQTRVKPGLDEVNRKRIDNVFAKFESRLKLADEDVFNDVIKAINTDIGDNAFSYFKTGEIDEYIHEKLSVWKDIQHVNNFGKGLLYQQDNILNNIFQMTRNIDSGGGIREELKYIQAKAIKFNELAEAYPDLISVNTYEGVNKFKDLISKNLTTLNRVGQLSEADFLSIETGGESPAIQAKIATNIIDNQITLDNKIEEPKQRLMSSKKLISGILTGSGGGGEKDIPGGLKGLLASFEQLKAERKQTTDTEIEAKIDAEIVIINKKMDAYTDTHGAHLFSALNNVNEILRGGKLNEEDFNYYLGAMNDMVFQDANFFTGSTINPINLITDTSFGFGIPIENAISQKDGTTNTSATDWISDMLDPVYNPNQSIDTTNYNNHKIKNKNIKNNNIMVDTTKTDTLTSNEHSQPLDSLAMAKLLGSPEELRKYMGISEDYGKNPITSMSPSDYYNIPVPKVQSEGFEDWMQNIKWNDEYTGPYTGELPVTGDFASFLNEEFGRKASGIDGNNWVTPGDNMISNLKNLRAFELYEQKDPNDGNVNKINEYKNKLKANYNDAMESKVFDKVSNINKTQKAYNMIMDLYHNPNLNSAYKRQGVNIDMSKANIKAFNHYLKTGNVIDGFSKVDAFNQLENASESIGGWGYSFDSSLFPTKW